MLGIVLLLCCLNALYQYLGAGRDDVFITLWAGKTLGTGPWFINYNGEPQEIASSIFGALIAKFAYLCCTETYYLANKLIGGGAALATLLVVWFNRRILFPVFPNFSAIATVALLGVNPSFAYWSLGGLETPYYALFILLYTVLAIRVFNPDAVTYRDYGSLILIQILAILCRPEGFWLIGITTALMLAYWNTLSDRHLTIIRAAILPPLLFLVALFALRYAMTGAIFPNPVYAKVSVSHLGGLQEGWIYLNQFYSLGLIGILLAGTTLMSCILVSYAALRLLFPRQALTPLASRLLVPALAICAYDVFIIIVKGDWMEYHRFLTPTLALKMLLLIMLVEKLQAMTPASFRRLASLAATILLALSIVGEWQYRSPRDCSTRFTIDLWPKFLDRPNDAAIALNCAHRRDDDAIRPFIDRELPHYLAQQGHLRIVTYQGGYFPYFIREQFSPRDITFVDTTGLLNLDIAMVEGENIPTGNKYLDDIPAILDGGVPGLSEKVSRYNPNMIYMLGDNETSQARLKAIGFEKIHQVPSAVIYLKTRVSTDGDFR
ncbi:MAG TPA: hypothetical protein DCS21_09965 [Gammaproteobacteria bacterium]|nr:hypothetical protein [Gammaproteobacteria bacterium]